jgi:hypothetical protein
MEEPRTNFIVRCDDHPCEYGSHLPHECAEYSEKLYDLAEANDRTTTAARLRAVDGSARRLGSGIPGPRQPSC